LNRARSSVDRDCRELDEAAERVDELHLLDGFAVGLEQARDQTSSTRHCAREVATLIRLWLKTNPRRRAASSALEPASETSTTGPPALELVHGADADAGGYFSRRARTCAL
jgi:hypothetical protein